MSNYPDALTDIGWMRNQLEALQRQVDELQRGPAVPQPTLLFGTYAAMVAVTGKALQRAWVDMSTESVVGRRGEWVYRPGTGWVRPWITGEFVPYQGQSVPAFCLPATGATYNASDYPDLAAAYGVSSGTFTVTNMGGRVIVGAGTVADANGTVQTFTQGTKGGEITHVLSVAEMPSHNHEYRFGYPAGGDGSGLAHSGTSGITSGGYGIQYRGGSQAMSLLQPWQAQPVAVRF